jgi:hypothetical protein
MDEPNESALHSSMLVSIPDAASLTRGRIYEGKQFLMVGIRAGRYHDGRRSAQGSLSHEYPASA